MRSYDKQKNMKSVNLLAEQRHLESKGFTNEGILDKINNLFKSKGEEPPIEDPAPEQPKEKSIEEKLAEMSSDERITYYNKQLSNMQVHPQEFNQEYIKYIETARENLKNKITQEKENKMGDLASKDPFVKKIMSADFGDVKSKLLELLNKSYVNLGDKYETSCSTNSLSRTNSTAMNICNNMKSMLSNINKTIKLIERDSDGKDGTYELVASNPDYFKKMINI